MKLKNPLKLQSYLEIRIREELTLRMQNGGLKSPRNAVGVLDLAYI